MGVLCLISCLMSEAWKYYKKKPYLYFYEVLQQKNFSHNTTSISILILLIIIQLPVSEIIVP